jgi:hypothetical protein
VTATPSIPWHVDAEHLAQYASDTCDPVVAASTEAHLLRCDACRRQLATVADTAPTDRRWARLADAVDQPSRTVAARLGLTHHHGLDHAQGIVRSAFGTPSLAWAGAVALLVAAILPVAAAAVHQTRGFVLLLALAPLVPVGAVTVAYRHSSDPVGEIVLSTPSSGLRLLALRAVAVGAAALPAGLISGWLSGLPPHVALAWLLPGLALAAIVLASCTSRVDPMTVAAVIAATWAVVVATPGSLHASAAARLVDALSAPGTQLACLLVGGAAVLLTVARRDAVAYRRTA